MMQRVQGPHRQYVSVYNVPDADREKEAGNRWMWSDPVKVKHWEERLDTDTHIFFRGMQRSRAWCGTPPILGVVNMVGTRNFTCYMGAL